MKLFTHRIGILHKHIEVGQRCSIGNILIQVDGVTDLVESRRLVVYIADGNCQGCHGRGFVPDGQSPVRHHLGCLKEIQRLLNAFSSYDTN